MRIALLGDLGFLGDYSISNNPQLKVNLSEISNFLEQFDLVVGNLETPFSIRKKTWGAKSSYLCTDVINVEVLKFLHIDAVSVANNHMYDFGKEGFETTINILEENGIQWFGANGKSTEYEFDNNRIKFEGFCCYSTNPLNIARTYGENGINRFSLPEVIELLKKNHSDGWFNIFAIHSGIEHVNTPSAEQILASRELAKVAPYVWYGHHPHVIQGVENHDRSFIAHSLGNFCFAGNKNDSNRPVVELSDNNRTGMIVTLEIENNNIISHNCQLTHIGEEGVLRLLNDNTIINVYSERIRKFYENPNLYKSERQNQRNVYISQRKELRNGVWMLKHLRPRYFHLFLENKINSKKYYKSIIKPLKDKGYEL